MQRSLDEIMGYKGYTLQAIDDDIGRCHDFLFDDRFWSIQYLVADTRAWLPGRKVLIPRDALGEPDWESRMFPVRLTRAQIQDGPPLDSDAPVSREYERQLHTYLGYQPYWERLREITEIAVENHLRSAKEVEGYRIRARDEEIGHVEDYIVDDETWVLRWLVIDTRNWLPGRKVLVSPRWAESIRWGERIVEVDLASEQIRQSPRYEPHLPVNQEYEQRLYDYYGRPVGWVRDR